MGLIADTRHIIFSVFFSLEFSSLDFFFPQRFSMFIRSKGPFFFFCLFANGIQILPVVKVSGICRHQWIFCHMNLIYFHQNKKYFLSFLPILKINILRRRKIFLLLLFFHFLQSYNWKVISTTTTKSSQEKQ